MDIQFDFRGISWLAAVGVTISSLNPTCGVRRVLELQLCHGGDAITQAVIAGTAMALDELEPYECSLWALIVIGPKTL